MEGAKECVGRADHSLTKDLPLSGGLVDLVGTDTNEACLSSPATDSGGGRAKECDGRSHLRAKHSITGSLVDVFDTDNNVRTDTNEACLSSPATDSSGGRVKECDGQTHLRAKHSLTEMLPFSGSIAHLAQHNFSPHPTYNGGPPSSTPLWRDARK